MDLLLAFLREDGGAAPLKNIGDAVGLGGAVPHPHGVQVHAAALQVLRDYGIAEPGAGEACRLGQGADLDRAGPRSGDLKDAVGQVFLNKRFIGRVEENHRAPGVRPGDPLGKLFPVISGAGGVVRGAQIDQVRFQTLHRQGQEMIVRAGGKMHNLPAGHGIGIHIGGVSRLHDQGAVRFIEQIQKVAQFVAGTAGNEHFVRSQGYPSLPVVLRDGFAEERRPAFRHITVKAGFFTLVVHCFMQRGDDCGCQREGNVPDPHAVKMLIRVGLQICFGLLGNMIEEVGLFQIRVAEVWRQHGITSKQ